MYVTSPVQAPDRTFAATSPVYFGQQGNRFGIAADGTAAAPVWLKLARSGAGVTASDLTDGQNWTTVGSATLPGSQPTEDIGMFATSHSPGNPGRVLFSGFAVTP